MIFLDLVAVILPVALMNLIFYLIRGKLTEKVIERNKDHRYEYS